MDKHKTYIAMGLMSGTSADGVDVAIIEANSTGVLRNFGGIFMPYTDAQRRTIIEAYGKGKDTNLASDVVTDVHIQAIKKCLAEIDAPSVDVIGFHGQTTYHAPKDGITIQIGDAQKIADTFAIPVVADFRTNDVKNGGQGAPLAPVYHKAICKDDNTAFLNLGGVGNITICTGDVTMAFDTGPANALMDDYMSYAGLGSYDKNGLVSSQGVVNDALLSIFKKHNYFNQTAPKSLDRDAFKIDFSKKDWSILSAQDAMATLAEMTVYSIIQAVKHCPVKLDLLVVCGGGSKNNHLMKRLQETNITKIITANDYGLNSDLLEAEAFAFLAVRHLEKMPLSFPLTTGVNTPCLGGVLFSF